MIFNSCPNIVFSPGGFKYLPEEGFNLGMRNHLREVTIMDFVPTNIPKDVVPSRSASLIAKTKLAATVVVGKIWCSSNYGQNWEESTSNVDAWGDLNWTSIAANKNGYKLAQQYLEVTFGDQMIRAILG